jgi:hypothetical protein
VSAFVVAHKLCGHPIMATGTINGAEEVANKSWWLGAREASDDDLLALITPGSSCNVCRPFGMAPLAGKSVFHAGEVIDVPELPEELR